MTVLTIRAQDTATAMDEIVEKLGKDSFIIGTKKIGNEILVKATNKPKKEIKPQKKVNQKFDEMISKELNVSSPLSTLKKDISTNKRGSNERLDLGYLNDDKIGLLMDDIYKLGLTNLFIEIGLLGIKKFKIDTSYAHLDSTSFHLHGEYNNIETSENDREADWKSIASYYCFPDNIFDNLRVKTLKSSSSLL